MMKNLIIIILSIFTLQVYAQDKPAYTIYDAKGKKASYIKLLKAANAKEVVFFGELHNNPIAHWLRFELAVDLHKKHGERLDIGAEMFETDNQKALSDFVSGIIVEDTFKTRTRLWGNYKTDYRPLLLFARDNKLSFIATNIPRRYASMVNRGGFEVLDTLPEAEKAFFPPLPIDYDASLPGYKAMLQMGMPGHISDNFPKAQAVKDATMAWFLYQNFKPGNVFLHLNGTYHTNNFEGIVWYLNRLNPSLKVLTIATVEQDNVHRLDSEHLGLADFILVVPSTMTKTY